MRKNFFLNLIVIVSVVCGCAHTVSAPPPDPVAEASVGVAGVVAHTESAERHVQKAMPHANPTGKVYLTAASEEHTEVLASAAHTQDALTATRQEVGKLNDALADQQATYQKLESRWFVRWGRWIERMLWIIGITWLLLGAASVALGMGNPLSWTWQLGKEITRFLPVMNAFSWIRDWIAARRAGSAATPAATATVLQGG